MSSDFYFKQWRQTLQQLQNTVDLDEEYQSSRAHDRTICDAVLRLSSILAEYTVSYKHLIECLHQNLQVQKTAYIEKVLHAVVGRILELKQQLRKLEGNEHHFLSQGLLFSKLTPFDAELDDIPTVKKRPEHLQVIVDEAFEAERERLRLIENAPHDEDLDNENWWDNAEEQAKEDICEEDKVVLTPEQIDTKTNVALIQAHERSRQVVCAMIRDKNKRIKWEKELLGEAATPAPLEIKEKGAKLIQCISRKYFEIKRKRIIDCKREEIIGIRLCLKRKNIEQETWEEKAVTRMKMKRKYEEARLSAYEKMKEKFFKLKIEDIKDDYRDFTTEWFKLWYKEIRFFHDIPDIKQGGMALAIKEDMPTPSEWLEQYQGYMLQKKANKNKSAMQLKYEKLEAKKEGDMKKKEEQKKAKQQELLRRKMMKNPNLHPGYIYPRSKKTIHVLEVIREYNEVWSSLDHTETNDVKVNVVKELDAENVCCEVKLEAAEAIDNDVRGDLKLLRKALKKEYEDNNEPMPEVMKEKKTREKKHKKVKNVASENVKEKIQDLIFRGFMKEYPKTKLSDYKGDPNFAGDNIRCQYKKAHYTEGEIRSIWWERCSEMVHGFHKILLVGPQGSGKTTLVHIMATLNDAVLFELDPLSVRPELQSEVYLNQVIHSLATCARTLQPAVVHIRHAHALFYKKVPPAEAENNYSLMSRYFVNKLIKRIHKNDNVTIVASCQDPWLTKSNQMLKKFPNVVILPKMSYSTVVQLLKEWVLSNHTIPPDLNVSCLAKLLQGYSYGNLKTMLKDLLSPERIIRIKAYGLTPMEVYNYILDQKYEEIEYEKYEKWYSERTATGIKEKKYFEDQLEFRRAVERFAEKAKLKKQKSSHSNLNY